MLIGSLVSAVNNNLEIEKITGTADPEITGLAYDSRDVKPGFLFFALKGVHTDGHRYIDKAANLGARAVFHSEELEEYLPDVVYIKVKNTRTAMAPVSAAFYGYPADKLTIIGVTGTDGKSTTVSLIHQLLTMSGYKTGFISTVQFNTGAGSLKNHYRQSTPEPTEIHRILDTMVKNGCTHAVIEATSHGLSPLNNRLGSITFSAGVLTNISHEHLEFHKTLERYIDDKANLFRKIKPESGTAVINRDEKNGEYFASISKAEKVYYSIKDTRADIRADNIRETASGESFTLHYSGLSIRTEINLPGLFNVENTLASLIAVHKVTGRRIDDLVSFLPDLKPVTGRMNMIDMGQDFSVIVDYAHTPGAFEKLFPVLRKRTGGKLIAVFGSAGERDTEKRKIQGEIASKYADIVILTDEDPRGEDSLTILKDIKDGCREKAEGKDLFLIPGRREAIRFAFKLAGKGDLAVLLGKGHESTIIYSEGTIPWNETEEAESALAAMGYKDKKEH